NFISKLLRELSPTTPRKQCGAISFQELFKGEKMNSVPRNGSRKLLASAAIGTLALSMAACGGEGSGDGDTVVIGYTGPLSGGGAAYGENVQIGLEIAVDDLNADGVEVDGSPITLELKSRRQVCSFDSGKQCPTLGRSGRR